MAIFNFVRASFYRDSVTLMRLSRDMEAVAGVTAAAAMMGTPHNRALLEQAGLLTAEGAAAQPADLIIAIAGDSPAAPAAARAAAEHALLARQPTTAGPTTIPARTLSSALKSLPDANLALISVPGAFAGAEALRALRAGLHVMLFSDNVPIQTEIECKRVALERGLLMLGPDCGTAILDGVPLGFANAVPRGRIGVAGASGTGLQEITCTIARGGEGISQAIGVGGRDLSDAVGGLMMLRAIELLGADVETRVVCVVGKPPGAGVVARIADALVKAAKPCVVCFPAPTTSSRGDAASAFAAAGAHVASTLEDAGRAAVALARGARPVATEFTQPPAELERLIVEATGGLPPGQQYVRGVYSGGTLAYEALGLLVQSLPDVAPSLTTGGPGHRVVDLGEDVFTLGRPHPMLDGRVRREWIDKEGRDTGTAVLLLDVVLGYGAHPDPVAELLPAIVAVRERRRLTVVASVCGTDADPQSRRVQIDRLRHAGVIVMESNAQAARLAAAIARRTV
jgi:FdrA protein